MSHPSLPSAALLKKQAEWLAPARARLLRRANIARCDRVLDLGCGSGAVIGELVRRASGPVVALDHDRVALTYLQSVCGNQEKLAPIQADAAKLPFADGSFDLVFCQFTLLWVDVQAAIGEIHRVLTPSGRLVAIEPDYEAMIEEPAEIATRELWLAALARAGAEPSIGRKLSAMLTSVGFSIRVDLLDHLSEPSSERFDLLDELPLESAERQALASIREADARLASSGTPRVAHLPIFLVTATKAP